MSEGPLGKNVNERRSSEQMSERISTCRELVLYDYADISNVPYTVAVLRWVSEFCPRLSHFCVLVIQRTHERPLLISIAKRRKGTTRCPKSGYLSIAPRIQRASPSNVWPAGQRIVGVGRIMESNLPVCFISLFFFFFFIYHAHGAFRD